MTLPNCRAQSFDFACARRNRFRPGNRECRGAHLIGFLPHGNLNFAELAVPILVFRGSSLGCTGGAVQHPPAGSLGEFLEQGLSVPVFSVDVEHVAIVPLLRHRKSAGPRWLWKLALKIDHKTETKFLCIPLYCRLTSMVVARPVEPARLIRSYRSNVLHQTLPASPVVPSSCAFTFRPSLNYSRVIRNGSVECF